MSMTAEEVQEFRRIDEEQRRVSEAAQARARSVAARTLMGISGGTESRAVAELREIGDCMRSWIARYGGADRVGGVAMCVGVVDTLASQIQSESVFRDSPAFAAGVSAYCK